MIERQLRKIIEQKYNTGKAIIVLGPRQTGKMTLTEMILSEKEGCLMRRVIPLSGLLIEVTHKVIRFTTREILHPPAGGFRMTAAFQG
ncbi:MAG: hypothetical protein A2X05_03440 [Bacteroidetes bacterium GWE2_41_25]|nr:MAG: hypothetical protein A2X03_15980 [Bacteroidetes bacterium GWA2_40_15]OFX91832.1 MAG: hypothetical protein A2X05_03440 [Bacteroidetes bacterium GWE2_41_25]OFX94035.1 MAG: hypothetical protein A2X06_14890 [Bacteroidetes bacterium GWC2_40_22]OFY59556.1 MAG: hypothetical protein A2X04_07740 [Bacteroidetes bacterium GWF2_41_9]HAM09753.1 hypothetical protein [Bacteroidales bacterium]